jgi:repressor LexA
MDITEPERIVLQFICDFWQTHGYSPTLREISEGCYMSSGNVYRFLDKLEVRGCIRREPNIARSIVIVADSPCTLETESDPKTR